MRVAVVDYGMGNLASVCRAVSEVGGQAFVADTPEMLRAADRIIVPGVGSFAEGMAQLDRQAWTPALHELARERNRPILGICLGMQLLASHGSEGGEMDGLGLLAADIVRLHELGCSLRLPHVGWNSLLLHPEQPCALLAGIPDGTDFYFVHSYGWRDRADRQVHAFVEYGVRVPAVVGVDLVWGTQFHPEKSSRAGFRLLKNFLELPC